MVVFDNLSRKGTEKNLDWLRSQHGKDFKLIKGDIRDYPAVKDVVKGVDTIYHCAAQVAVTTSVSNPREDFDINALGTFNVLEAARESKNNPIIIFTSTNKVYGGMEDLKAVEKNNRYEYKDYPHGISEEMPLDFHSPLRMFKRCGRPVYKGLCKDIWDEDCSFQDVMYLWSKTVWK